jgi:hypothetical protein
MDVCPHGSENGVSILLSSSVKRLHLAHGERRYSSTCDVTAGFPAVDEHPDSGGERGAVMNAPIRGFDKSFIEPHQVALRVNPDRGASL